MLAKDRVGRGAVFANPSQAKRQARGPSSAPRRVALSPSDARLLESLRFHSVEHERMSFSVQAHAISHVRRKNITSIRGRNGRLSMRSYGLVPDDLLTGSFKGVYDDHNRFLLLFTGRDLEGEAQDQRELNAQYAERVRGIPKNLVPKPPKAKPRPEGAVIRRTVVGSRWDKRPVSETGASKYNLKLFQRRKHASKYAQALHKKTVKIDLTYNRNLLSGLIKKGYEEYVPYREDVERIAGHLKALECEFEEYKKTFEFERAQVTLDRIKECKRELKEIRKARTKLSIAGKLFWTIAERIACPGLTWESFTLEEWAIIYHPLLYKRFMQCYYRHIKREKRPDTFIVQAIEPQQDGMVHAHLVFAGNHVASHELISKEWWPWGYVWIKAMTTKHGLNGVNYAVKYVTKNASMAVHSDTQVSAWHVFVWYYGMRLFNFSHNLPKVDLPPTTLCVGAQAGEDGPEHIFCRYRDDYKDSGTDWTEATSDRAPPISGRGMTMKEAHGIIAELCGEWTPMDWSAYKPDEN